ncbi:MAG: ABC transporter permease [Candidatus Helarchaeota archaeon]
MIKKIFYIALRDLKLLFSNKVYVLTQYLGYFVLIFIYSSILNLLIPFLNYTAFYSSGMVVLTLWTSSMVIAHRLSGEHNTHVFEYLLSLPVSRTEYLLGRTIGTSVTVFVYVGPIILISVILSGTTLNVPNMLIALGFLYLFVLGATGFAIVLGSAIHSAQKIDIIIGTIDAFLIKISTIYYPQFAIPLWIRPASYFNPLSHLASIYRWGLGLEMPLFLFSSFLFISAISIILFIVSYKAFKSRIQAS